MSRSTQRAKAPRTPYRGKGRNISQEQATKQQAVKAKAVQVNRAKASQQKPDVNQEQSRTVARLQSVRHNEQQRNKGKGMER